VVKQVAPAPAPPPAASGPLPEPLRSFGYVFSGADRILGVYGRLEVGEDAGFYVAEPLVCVTHCARAPTVASASDLRGRLRASPWRPAGRDTWRWGRYELRLLFEDRRPDWSLLHVVLLNGTAPALAEHLTVHVDRHLAALTAAAPSGEPFTPQFRPIGLRAAIRALLGRRVVVYTGAGISRPSGIPTFAGVEPLGEAIPLDEPFPGEVVARIVAQPERFVRLVGNFQARLVTAAPNAAHVALARLEQLGQVAHLVTSNLDPLHERAGSARVGSPATYIDALLAGDDAETLLVLGVSEDRYELVACCRAAGLRIVAAGPEPPQFLSRGDAFVAVSAAGLLSAWLEAARRRHPRAPVPLTPSVYASRFPARRRSPRDAIPSFPALLRTVTELSPSRHSTVHGVGHWRETAADAVRLLRHVREADPAVALVFALVHDALRADDLDDSAHGIRAAELVRSLARDGGVAFHPAQVELAAVACEHHSEPLVAVDPTIGLCWDADRLGLRRLGIVPDPALLSLDVSRRLPLDVEPSTWTSVYARYLALVASRA
jgi:uncharacterized protein